MNKVVSRRTGGVQQTIVTKDVHHSKNSSSTTALPAPPRSNQFILPVFHERASADDDHSVNSKRKYKVNLPARMLCILAMIFLLVPLVIFGYRETHLNGTTKQGPHFKVEKYVNVNTEDVLLQISKRNKELDPLFQRPSTGDSDSDKNHDTTSQDEQPEDHSGEDDPSKEKDETEDSEEDALDKGEVVNVADSVVVPVEEDNANNANTDGPAESVDIESDDHGDAKATTATRR
jgi:hypothetical protein